MFILSQDKLWVQEMTGSMIGSSGNYLILKNASGEDFKVGKYDTADDCKLVVRIINGAIQTGEKMLEIPTREEIAGFHKYMEDAGKALGKLPENLEELLKQLKKMLEN